MEIVNEIKMIPIGDIKPYEKNPRKNSKTVELLCKVIPRVGFNVPLVLDENNVIVKGHARWLAAQALGMDAVPCVISHASPEEIKADRIADNKVFEFSKWLDEELLHEVDMLDLGFDLGEFGLPTIKMDSPEFGFDLDDDYDDVPEESDEERRRRFEEFMAQQEQDAPKVEIVTPQEIEHAKQRLKEEPQKHQASYLSVVCEKCGHTFFVREGDAMSWE